MDHAWSVVTSKKRRVGFGADTYAKIRNPGVLMEDIFSKKILWNEHPKILFEFHKHMAEILLAISAWQLAMRLKQPMSRAGCYTFCQPSSVSNHWLFVPVPPLTWVLMMRMMEQEWRSDCVTDDGMGCGQIPGSSFFGGVRAAQFRSDALSLGYRDVHPALAFPCWNAVSNTILHETTQGTPFGGSFIKHLRVTWHHHPYPIV